jgi:prepilin-type N-terminal cleavage/methylation domain-containing protein
MKKYKGFTLLELMIVILIVAILAAVAVPILRARIEAAKWTEGKTMAGSIAVAIRTWVVGTTGSGPWNHVSLDAEKLGFQQGDLTGIYFDKSNFQWFVSYNNSKLVYSIIINRPDGINAPEKMFLDDDGNWSK